LRFGEDAARLVLGNFVPQAAKLADAGLAVRIDCHSAERAKLEFAFEGIVCIMENHIGYFSNGR